MKTIEFCDECVQNLGHIKITFFNSLAKVYLDTKLATCLTLKNDNEFLKMIYELEILGYIVTHEDSNHDIFIFPKDIEPKVSGCHLYCGCKKLKKTEEI